MIYRPKIVQALIIYELQTLKHCTYLEIWKFGIWRSRNQKFGIWKSEIWKFGNMEFGNQSGCFEMKINIQDVCLLFY